MNEEENKKAKLGEKISLKFRKKLLVGKMTTFLVVLILILAYIILNLMVSQLDLPIIDTTQYKVYTLSDASKKAVEKIDKDITIYAYGFEENKALMNFLKQYHEANDKIKYEVLSEETNKDLVTKYELEEGYMVLILKSGDSEKIISSSEFTTYDYTTYNQIDVTEQTITNSLLSLTEEHKPNVYLVSGHGEYTENELGVLVGFLRNEAFTVNTLNIATQGKIPDDCNILAIMSPTKDFMETEVAAVKEYINRGGNIFFTKDLLEQGTELPNIQSILDEYGVSVENGYILENSSAGIADYPYIFTPAPSAYHQITQDIASDSYMFLMYSGRLNFKTDDELKALNVEKEILLSSSETSSFITELSKSLSEAQASAQTGASNISAILTKTIPASTENQAEGSTSEDVKSNLVIVANGLFVVDTRSPLSDQYPISYLGSNKDFAINAMSYLGKKDNILTIRKDISPSTTYQPTNAEHRVVIAIIVLVPIFIILLGIMIYHNRKKRK